MLAGNDTGSPLPPNATPLPILTPHSDSEPSINFTAQNQTAVMTGPVVNYTTQYTAVDSTQPVMVASNIQTGLVTSQVSMATVNTTLNQSQVSSQNMTPTTDLKDEQDSTIDETESIDSNGSRRDASSPRGRGTARGVTLTSLIQEKILEAGQGILSIDYLGQKYIGDLLPTGKISWKGMQFASPSSWAIYVKKQVNPSKKSGCGWNSVKYKGKKLDWFKSMYSKKHQSPSANTTPGQSPQTQATDEDSNRSLSNGTLNAAGANVMPDNRMIRDRKLMKHCQLKDISEDLDMNTLVELENYETPGAKTQPFSVNVSTNCLLVMDFHCHLTTGEVVGYLGGMWDQENQSLNIIQAFPCRCRLGDKEKAVVAEEEIRLALQSRGLSKVGWYHSHPTCQAYPTLRDIDCQTEYQMKLGTNNPVLALICAPFNISDTSLTESIINAFSVSPPTEFAVHPNASYGIPMRFTYVKIPDTTLSQDLFNEMNWLNEFYKSAPDFINFSKIWKGNMTYLEKLKHSLCGKLPKNPNSGNIIQYIQKLLSSTSL